MFAWTHCVLLLVGVFGAKANFHKGTFFIPGDTVQNPNWESSRQQGIPCSLSNLPGKCVPTIDHCPVLELKIRNILPAYQYEFSNYFYNACGEGNGYCCPDVENINQIIVPDEYSTIPGSPVFDELNEDEQSIGDIRPEAANENFQCGKVNDVHTFVTGGEAAYIGQFPWHAGIYLFNPAINQSILQCGGSLISKTVVLSAAHCFRYYVRGRIEPFQVNISDLKIAVGKIYSAYDHIMDTRTHQKRSLREVIIHQDWAGADDHYKNDIAMAILASPIKFSDLVSPICIDFSTLSGSEESILKDQTGQIAGWGKTSFTSSEATFLNFANLTYVDRVTCKNQSSLRTYVREDKLCATNREKQQAVCNGDSGGGFVFEDLRTRTWYLRGIISLGQPRCDGSDFGLFTRVSKHLGFISSIASTFYNVGHPSD